MLFLLNTAGVPSIARIVRLSNDAIPLPSAPTNLSASAVSTSQINLSWTDNASNETGFRIERSPDGTSFTEIATRGGERHDLRRHRLERVDPVLVSRTRVQR